MKFAVNFLTVVFLVAALGTIAAILIWQFQEHECPPTSFRCPLDGRCISKRLRCDGTNHCKNGSDEQRLNCTDLTTTKDFIHRYIISCGIRESVRPYYNVSENSTEIDYTTTTEVYETDNSTNSSVADILHYPAKCDTKNEGRALSCSDPDWSSGIPWHEIDAHTQTLYVQGGLNVTQLNISRMEWLYDLHIRQGNIQVLRENTFCPLKNICRLYFTNNSLRTIEEGAFCSAARLKFLNLASNELTLKGFRFRGLPRLTDLFLEKNKISYITSYLFRDLRKLIGLNLSHNRIYFIHERAFRYNVHLQDLELNFNRLHSLAGNIFQGQKKMTKLYLGFNPFKSLTAETFKPIGSVVSLNLEDVDIQVVDVQLFKHLKKLDYVFFKSFQYCRFVPMASRCFPVSDGLSSTSDLLTETSLRRTVWIVAFLSIIGNMIVLVSRHRRGGILDVFTSNLAGSDFLMGIYLFTLGFKDIEYRAVYHINAYNWTTSYACSAIGILAMISSEVSLLILALMSFERYLVISGKASYQQPLTVRSARVSIAIIWLFVTALAIAPAIVWREEAAFYGSTGLCFPLHLDDPFATGWQYTAFVFIGLNSLCLIIITLSYGKLFLAVRKTRHATTLPAKDTEVTVRCFLMVLTDFISWAPIVGLKIMVLQGHQIPNKVIAWFLVLVLPINSAINPFLYTFSTEEVREKIWQRFFQKAQKSKRISDANVTSKSMAGTSEASTTNSLLHAHSRFSRNKVKCISSYSIDLQVRSVENPLLQFNETDVAESPASE